MYNYHIDKFKKKKTEFPVSKQFNFKHSTIFLSITINESMANIFLKFKKQFICKFKYLV